LRPRRFARCLEPLTACFEFLYLQATLLVRIDESLDLQVQLASQFLKLRSRSRDVGRTGPRRTPGFNFSCQDLRILNPANNRLPHRCVYRPRVHTSHRAPLLSTCDDPISATTCVIEVFVPMHRVGRRVHRLHPHPATSADRHRPQQVFVLGISGRKAFRTCKTVSCGTLRSLVDDRWHRDLNPL
jgi:hypothetical protein